MSGFIVLLSFEFCIIVILCLLLSVVFVISVIVLFLLVVDM